MLPRPSGLVTLLTDFGPRDPYVGLMKGAVLRANQKATIIDYGHDVPPQDVMAGAFWLAVAIGQFPAGTVHVAVVDPGVGTSRRLLAMAAHESYWLAPDNGLLGHVFAQDPTAEVRAIDLSHLALRPRSRTFHGRDVLAPIAGWLTSGRYGFTALGPPVVDRLAGASPFDGPPRVIHVDAFGNLVTNVAASALADVSRVRVGGHTVALRGTYAEAAPGELLALVGSFDRLEVAQNGGNAARTLGLSRGAPIELMYTSPRP
ncbi:MAG TPA: SAM-dependent chlorinase/fluorinase [Planctomycetota bacterium]|nr:SAM-dependent chlorinase/fluorinase [Planctomycetota bacterium]